MWVEFHFWPKPRSKLILHRHEIGGFFDEDGSALGVGRKLKNHLCETDGLSIPRYEISYHHALAGGCAAIGW
jgi:hypothetical protein